MEKLHKFDRLSRVIGDDKVLQLTEKTVLVLGVGGVGG
jgi:tRNA A37 threonylcarbamoyladenosine dehydratase